MTVLFPIANCSSPCAFFLTTPISNDCCTVLLSVFLWTFTLSCCVSSEQSDARVTHVSAFICKVGSVE